MEKDKAPGPDCLSTDSYQKFWEVIKKDIMAMFNSFQNGGLPLFHLNCGTTVLFSKK
jgi:hypothetical protein